MLLESGGRRVEVRGEALPGPENARLMRKAGEKNEKRRSARWQNAQREEKKQWRTGVSSNPPQTATRRG